MRINIASYGGRNWLLDTAKELSKHGHDVRFYSFLPTKRAVKYGLNRESNASYFLLALPFLALLKVTNRANWALFVFHYFFDHYVGWFARPCDIFIGQSPMHVFALKRAKNKHKATVILERGTRHINEQIKVLRANPYKGSRNPMPQYFINRDLLGYQLADYISVPSTVVKESFLINLVPSKKLFVNPFGVTLTEFKATELSSEANYDLIMVGQWCYRKGCDLLINVCKNNNLSLLHVGVVLDIEFPNYDGFKHIDPVDQKKLVNYYSQAKVFVLPSREEGLALVQPQALLCGLPIVCSKFTGGSDLKQFLNTKEWIVEMENLSEDELYKCIQTALALASTQKGLRSYSSGVEHALSWDAYGTRYHEFIKNKLV